MWIDFFRWNVAHLSLRSLILIGPFQGLGPVEHILQIFAYLLSWGQADILPRTNCHRWYLCLLHFDKKYISYIPPFLVHQTWSWWHCSDRWGGQRRTHDTTTHQCNRWRSCCSIHPGPCPWAGAGCYFHSGDFQIVSKFALLGAKLHPVDVVKVSPGSQGVSKGWKGSVELSHC